MMGDRRIEGLNRAIEAGMTPPTERATTLDDGFRFADPGADAEAPDGADIIRDFLLWFYVEDHTRTDLDEPLLDDCATCDALNALVNLTTERDAALARVAEDEGLLRWAFDRLDEWRGDFNSVKAKLEQTEQALREHHAKEVTSDGYCLACAPKAALSENPTPEGER